VASPISIIIYNYLNISIIIIIIKAAQVTPIVISPTGVIPKSLSQSLTRLNQHPNTYTKLQKPVILDTYSIVRSFLNHK